LLENMPAVFRDPHDDPACTDASYFMPSGVGMIGSSGRNNQTAVKSITDGTSKTILLVEARRPIPWTMPEDIEIDPGRGKPMPKSGGHFEPADGFARVLAGGEPKLVSNQFDRNLLRSLMTFAGGEKIADAVVTQPVLGGGMVAAASAAPAGIAASG